MKIYLTTGTGTGPTTLAAFDSALHANGIDNYNLLRLSSVIPPGTDLVQTEGAIPSEIMPGKWGDRLYVVMAEERVDEPGKEAWAGIGWVQEKGSNKGLFVEHEGNSEEKVRDDITQSLKALMETRGIDFGPINMQVVGTKCVDKPACAMAVAVYQASDWENQAEFIR